MPAQSNAQTAPHHYHHQVYNRFNLTTGSNSINHQSKGSRSDLAESSKLVANQLVREFTAYRCSVASNEAQNNAATSQENPAKKPNVSTTPNVTSQLFSSGTEQILSRELTKLAVTVLQEAKKFMLKSKRTTLQAQDLLNALKYRGLNHYYYLVADKLFSSNNKDNVDINSTVELNNNKILDVNLIHPTIHAHWLCIDGVQPMINENPDVAKIEKEAENKLMSSLKTSQSNPLTNKADITVEGLNLLTYEQQLLFSNMTEMCFGADEEKQSIALSLLRSDPGFADILPHFISFIVEGVRLNVNEQNMVNLIYLMRMSTALVTNPHLNIEHYLHDLIPAIMTCTLSKTLYKKSEDSHWALRDYSAKLIATIYNRKTNAFNNHHTQILRILDEIIDSDNLMKYSWNAKYGAVKILCDLNYQVLQVHLLNKVKILYSKMKDELDDPDSDALAQKAIQKIIQLLQIHLGNPQFWTDIKKDVNKDDFIELFGPDFGETLYLCATNTTSHSI